MEIISTLSKLKIPKNPQQIYASAAEKARKDGPLKSPKNRLFL